MTSMAQNSSSRCLICERLPEVSGLGSRIGEAGMHLVRWISSIVGCFALTLLALPAVLHAQDQSDPCASAKSQPSDVSLRLSLKNGQTAFREGEIITLAAEYSSSSDKKYYLNTRGYDRSGRLSGMELFCIDPESGKDPLSDYFNGTMGFIGGGLGSEKELSSDPYTVNLELNEWKSLPPGSYRLTILSRRVASPTEQSPNGIGVPPVPLRSNEIEFQVIKADPEWQAEQLGLAEQALDSADPGGEDAKHAARVLRFLSSEAAAQEMARRFWSGNDQPSGWDLKFGLVGSPYRKAVIEEMKAVLKDPQHPVTQEFVQTLALLEIQSDPKYKLTPYDEKNQEAWGKARDAYTQEFNRLITEHMSELASVLPGKTGRARAVSVDELLQSDVALSPAAKAQLRQMLLASWDALPARQQNELIQYRWDQIGGPELLPILRRVVNGQPNPNRQIDKPDRASALRHIYELASSEGRELILREVANPRGDINIEVLGMLPDRDLPQIEQPILAKLKVANGTDIDYQLIARYASVRVLPEIKALYEAHQGEWACVPQDAMLQYFLRVSPDYGALQVSAALTHRKVTGCYQFQLTALNEYIRRPKLERIAIAALDDPSPEVTRNAAEALAKYGTAKAEPALWARLAKFHEKWKDRANELRYRPGANTNLNEIGLEQALVQAITNGQAWFATEETVQKLKELASPQVQPELDGVLSEIQRADYGVNLNWWPDGKLNYSVGRYTGKGMAPLKEKLAQFPAGAHLNLITTVAERDRHRAEFAELENAAAADGLVLQVQTPR